MRDIAFSPKNQAGLSVTNNKESLFGITDQISVAAIIKSPYYHV